MKSVTSQLKETCSKTVRSAEFSDITDHCQSSNRKQTLYAMFIFQLYVFCHFSHLPPLSALGLNHLFYGKFYGKAKQ